MLDGKFVILEFALNEIENPVFRDLELQELSVKFKLILKFFDKFSGKLYKIDACFGSLELFIEHFLFIVKLKIFFFQI